MAATIPAMRRQVGSMIQRTAGMIKAEIRCTAGQRTKGSEGEEVEFPVRNQAGATPTPESNPEFEYLRQVHAAFTDAKLDIWEGGPLHGKRIARLTRPPSSGWRPPKKEGIWSAGSRSEIGFLLPKTDDEIGPHAIKLIVGGEYFGNNVTTQVRIGDYECRKDLTRAEIIIPLDENTRKKGIHIVLEHDKPLPPGNPDAEATENGIAFYLQFTSYAFLWE